MISLGEDTKGLPVLELRIELFDLRSSLAVDRRESQSRRRSDTDSRSEKQAPHSKFG